MTTKKGQSDDAAALRREAEKKLAAKYDVNTEEQPQKQLHELMVHQIELEMQNEELQKLRIESDELLERYTHLYEFAPIPYLTLKPDSTILKANHAAEKMFNDALPDLYRKRLGVFVSDDSKSLFNALIDKALASHQQESCEVCLLINGLTYWYVFNAIAEKSGQSVLVAALDITDRKNVEEKLKLASIVYLSLSEAILVLDHNNVIININPAFTQLTGYTTHKAIGQSAKDLKTDMNEDLFYPAIWEILDRTGLWEGEVCYRRKHGENYCERLTMITIYDKKGKVQWRVATFFDITQQKIIEEISHKQANYDLLSGLPNRRMFLDRLHQEIKKSIRSKQKFALMYLDIDRFKAINDSLGHDMGDILIKETAHRLSWCIREVDTVARSGGDEFTILVGELKDFTQVERIAECILKTMMDPFQLGDALSSVSVSIGISIFPDDAKEADDLMKKADQAMYTAKNQGRNCRCYFTEVMQEQIQKKLKIANDLHSMIQEKQIQIVYQPIVHLTTGHIYKAEAFLRWKHPQYGLMSPASFIPIAEETGMIMSLDNWVFQQVTQQVTRWRKLFYKDFQIGINTSPVLFKHTDDPCSSWVYQLDSYDLEPNSISIEIKELLLIEDQEEIVGHLQALQRRGIDITMDNFGTGYSSLSYLNKLNIDYLKIDLGFVADLTNYPSSLALCEAIVLMAHKLDMQVIAEGVETEEQRDLLLDAGCDYGQGYLFCQPIPPDEFEQFLKKNS